MSYQAANRAIENRFGANWGSTTPIKFPNVDFNPPENDAYVSFEITDSDGIPISIGDPILYRHTGLISVNIYLPLGTGTDTGWGYCDTVVAIFRKQNFSTINCYDIEGPTQLGEVDGRFVFNVTILFERDEAF